MPQTKPIVSVENVVASASVDQKLDLIEITKKFPDTEYHPEQFPGLVFRLKTPRTATLIFRKKLTEDIFENEKINLTPEAGFDLVGIDYFADSGNQLYLVKHFVD